VSQRRVAIRCAVMIVICAIPARLFALNLDFLRDTPVMYLTEADKKLQREAALFVLEHEDPNASREWQNPQTGYSGRIEGQGDLISDDGLKCRKLKIVVHAKGGESVFVLPLCKNPQGEWLFGSGAIALDDRRFAPSNVRRGVWSPGVFRKAAQGGLYFVDGYDERRIPVLFIHGIYGSPRDFRFLIEQLDRWRLQPCVFFYPSGASLHDVARELAEELRVLRSTRGVSEMLVVAHSMGGLIARDVLINESNLGVDVPALVTISTPWRGHKGAALARYAPVTVDAWLDLATDSAYITSLFGDGSGRQTSLPTQTRHHLIFSYGRRWTSFGPANDEVVSVASQLSRPAQEQAYRIYGFNTRHSEILNQPATAELLNRILTTAVASPWSPVR
jgi:pimeloyl-ACP methyl ester carboxylesterase